MKNFLAKKKLNKSLVNVSCTNSTGKVKSVGVLIDEAFFQEKEALVKDLLVKGIQLEDIKILVYKSHLKKEDIHTKYPLFSDKDIGWSNTIKSKEVQSFIDEKFDLLINYYDREVVNLYLVTFRSQADFKVGFPSVDSRLNHFMIDIGLKKHQIFTDELFKYLKILNKL